MQILRYKVEKDVELKSLEIVNFLFFCFLGTRIIYERKFLLDLKSSPLSQTPTKLPIIPGVTLDSNGKIIEEEEEDLNNKIPECPKVAQNGDAKKSNGTSTFSLL